jgi:hypothetical protein
MKRYREKLDVVEAIQFTSSNDIPKILDWMNGGGCKVVFSPDELSLKIETPRGHGTIILGDWIIKDKDGEFHLYESYVFEQIYEEVPYEYPY